MSEPLVGPLPDGWTIGLLGELCTESGGNVQTGPFGSQLHAADYVKVGIPSVMPINIGDNRIVADGIARVGEVDVMRLAKYRLRVGDIVYSRRGDVERRALVRGPEDGWLCGTGCLRVRVGGSVDSLWLSYYLGHPEVRAWIVRHAVGATMPNLNTAILSALPVAVPPLSEQRAIAEILRALDDKVDLNRRTIRIAQQLADAQYILWRRGLDVSTATGSFSDLAEVHGGSTPKTTVPEYWGGDHAWAVPRDVTALQAPYLFDTGRHITGSGLLSIGNRKYPSGSIFMTSRATIGAFAVLQRSCAANQGFIVVVPREPIFRWFLFHEMRHRVDDMLDLANGSTFLELSRGNFKTMSTVLPRRSALARLDAALAPLHEWCAALVQETARLIDVREALLPRLLSGELRVRDVEQLVGEAV